MIILNHRNFYTKDFVNELINYGCQHHPELKLSNSNNFIIKNRENSKLLNNLFDLYIKENKCFII